jgi:hypothetical protein
MIETLILLVIYNLITLRMLKTDGNKHKNAWVTECLLLLVIYKLTSLRMQKTDEN